MVSDKLSVGELMTTQMTALEPIMLVSKLESVLKRCAHQAFPITTEVEKAFAASKPHRLAVHKHTGKGFCLQLSPLIKWQFCACLQQTGQGLHRKFHKIYCW